MRSASSAYSGALTAEQFLFYEIRIVAKLHLQGKSLQSIIVAVKEDNLFQYPTEREVARLAKACHKRIIALDNEYLVRELCEAPHDVAKQINLYAMMRQNRLVWDFMVYIIGEKYCSQNSHFFKKDVNIFLSHLQEQSEIVAKWSNSTISKIRQVLIKCLVETEFLDNPKSEILNNVYLSAELEAGIRMNNDMQALSAFNCFN